MVISVRAAAAQPLPRAAATVKHEEQRPPTLVLRDVNPFVRAMNVVACVGAGQHDVPQRDGAVRQRGQCPGDRLMVVVEPDFDDAGYTSRRATQRAKQQCRQCADQRAGGHPQGLCDGGDQHVRPRCPAAWR